MTIKRRILALVLLSLLSVAVLMSSCASTPEETPEPQTATVEPAAAPPGTPMPTAGVGPQTPVGPTAPAIPPSVEVALEHIQRLEGVTLAKVNGNEITWEDYEPTLRQALVMITQQYGIDWSDLAMQERLADLQQQVLKQTVDRWLLRQMAEEQGIAVDEQDLEAEIESEKSDALNSGRYAGWEDFLQTNGLTEKSFRQMIYDTLLLTKLLAAQDVETQADQVWLAHIALGDEATAQEVSAKLKAGEDFAELAKQYSLDSQTKEKGGDLGWFTQEMLQPEMAQMVFALQPGQFTEPIGTPQGYVIYQVLGREVRELDPRALRLKQQQAATVQLEAVRAEAQIEYLVDFTANQE